MMVKSHLPVRRVLICNSPKWPVGGCVFGIPDEGTGSDSLRRLYPGEICSSFRSSAEGATPAKAPRLGRLLALSFVGFRRAQ